MTYSVPVFSWPFVIPCLLLLPARRMVSGGIKQEEEEEEEEEGGPSFSLSPLGVPLTEISYPEKHFWRYRSRQPA